MTYFTILGIFIVPPLILLSAVVGREVWSWLAGRGVKPDLRPYGIILAHVALALIYTTPWDNYLVATNVWWYDPKLVTGLRLGWVPIEEYTFFVLMTLLTGLLTMGLLRRYPPQMPEGGDRPRLRLAGALIIGLIWMISTTILLSDWKAGTYLTLIVSWALLPILTQVIFGLDILLANWRVVLGAILPPSLYLWAVDAVALQAGTWVIDPRQTTSIKLGVMPVEEMLFFFITNVIIVFGVTLMNSPHSQKRAQEWWERLRANIVNASDELISRLWTAALVMWIGVLIATPIGIWTWGEAVFPALVTMGVLAQASASLLALRLSWSGGKIRRAFLVVIGLSWLIEVIGVRTGLLFGSYHYTDLLQPQAGGVPLVIPLAWMMMLAPAWALTEALLRTGVDKLGGVGSQIYRLVFAGTAGLAFAAWDLYLDPQMVSRGLWEWQTPGAYFGVPLTNYAGWWLGGALITWIAAPKALDSGRLISIYILTWLFQAVGLGVFWGQPGPALTGFIGMGLFVVLAMYREGAAWQRYFGFWLDFSAVRSRTRPSLED